MELPPAPGRSWRAFNEQDPFNDHRMAGYINLAPHGRRYGALIIHAVDSIPCDQFVWATPSITTKKDYDRIWSQFVGCLFQKPNNGG